MNNFKEFSAIAVTVNRNIIVRKETRNGRIFYCAGGYRILASAFDGWFNPNQTESKLLASRRIFAKNLTDFIYFCENKALLT